MTKTYLALAFLITAFLASDAYGEEEIYYCAETASIGFMWNVENNRYGPSAFAEETEIYTCAEIEGLANEAARIALATRRNIETQDIIEAKRVVIPSLTAEEVERMRCPLH